MSNRTLCLALACVCTISALVNYNLIHNVFHFSTATNFVYKLRNTHIISRLEVNLTKCNKSAPFESRPIVANLTVPDEDTLMALSERLLPGGRFKTSRCSNPDRVAIIVPYRGRSEHLKVLLRNLHPFLQRQDLQYGIYVSELVPDVPFNKAVLMNAGYSEAFKMEDYQCFIFHDVDLIPEDDANWYTCPREQPRHMSAAIDKFNYRLQYKTIVGGVMAMTKEQFENVNGYSNHFFGWGSEDDDMYLRIKRSGYNLTRYPATFARYKMIKHKRDIGNQENPRRHYLIRTSHERHRTDGLNSVKYQLIEVKNMNNLYTRILVNFTKSLYE